MQGDAVRERRQREDANLKGRKEGEPEGRWEGGRERRREGGRMHRPVSGDTKGKGCNDNVPGGGTDDGQHCLRCSGTRLGSISSYLLSCL